MGKFETPGQIVTLFVGAACVGVLLIVLLTAEANKRKDTLDRRNEIVVTETEDMSELTGIKYIWNKMKSSLRSLSESDKGLESEQKNRRKREINPDYYSNHVIEGEYDDVVESIETENTNDDIDDIETENTNELQKLLTEMKPSKYKKSQLSVTADLGSALLSSALSGHKIRHIEEKISMLGEDSQLVQAVLDMFCNKDETVLYVMCMDTANSTKKNTTKANTEHEDEKKDNGIVGTNNTVEHSKNYTDDISSYVNVMRNRLAPQVSSSFHSTGICSSSTEFIVVVILTSFANFFVFVMMSMFCRISKKGIATELTESNKYLIAGDDDLENREEGNESVHDELKKKSGNVHVNLCHQIGFNEEFNKI